MNDNRYAAPATVVADVEDVAIGQRPRNVVIGVTLLWIQLALGIPGMVYQALNPPVEITEELVRTITVVTMAVVMTGSVVLYSLLNWKCWQGRNWARIVHLVFLGLRAGRCIYWALPKTFGMSTVQGVGVRPQTSSRRWIMAAVGLSRAIGNRPVTWRALRDPRPSRTSFRRCLEHVAGHADRRYVASL